MGRRAPSTLPFPVKYQLPFPRDGAEVVLIRFVFYWFDSCPQSAVDGGTMRYPLALINESTLHASSGTISSWCPVIS